MTSNFEGKKELSEPGNKIHGNFPFYYQFNPVSARLSLFSDKQLLTLLNASIVRSTKTSSNNGEKTAEPVLCLLDIGCNQGDLTVALAQRIHKLTGIHVFAEGWDIDEELIEKAREKFGHAKDNAVNSENGGVTCVFHTMDVSNEEAFLQAASNTLKPFGKNRYDLVCLFSVTMWIHVHSGDEEFLHILDRICSKSESLIVEPQESKSYGSCRRRIKRVGGELPPKLDGLKLRGVKLFPTMQMQFERNGLSLVPRLEHENDVIGADKVINEDLSKSLADQPPKKHKEQQPKVQITAWKRPLWLFIRK